MNNNLINTFYILATLTIVSSALYAGEPITVEYNHDNCAILLPEKYLKIISLTEPNRISYNITFNGPHRSITISKTTFHDGHVNFDGYKHGNGREIGPENIDYMAQQIFEEITEIVKPK